MELACAHAAAAMCIADARVSQGAGCWSWQPRASLPPSPVHTPAHTLFCPQVIPQARPGAGPAAEHAEPGPCRPRDGRRRAAAPLVPGRPAAQPRLRVCGAARAAGARVPATRCAPLPVACGSVLVSCCFMLICKHSQAVAACRQRCILSDDKAGAGPNAQRQFATPPDCTPSRVALHRPSFEAACRRQTHISVGPAERASSDPRAH